MNRQNTPSYVTFTCDTIFHLRQQTAYSVTITIKQQQQKILSIQ